MLIPAAVVLLPLSGVGQVIGAVLTGSITDPAGAAIPAAAITVKNVDTNTMREVVTNSAGIYVVPNLAPGLYSVQVAVPNFSVLARETQLSVGSKVTVDFRLKLESFSQTVNVAETRAQRTDSGMVVTGQDGRELPLNGRDWTQTATLQPGVLQVRTQPDASGTSNRGTRGFGLQLAISGGRPQQNYYRLDGIGLNDYAGSLASSALGLSLGVETIGEFSVVTGNIPASYGQSSAGIVDAVTRRGGNVFHGSAYEYVRND